MGEKCHRRTPVSQVIVNVLCEGKTEESFAKIVLKKYLEGFGIAVKSRILFTNKKKNAKGGLISYAQVKNDIQSWISEHKKEAYEAHYYTTMFDLYALPNDFPGYEAAFQLHDCYQRVLKLEEEFAKDVNLSGCFIPYIQLHEFEALVFCGLDYLLIDYPNMTKQIENLKKVVKDYSDNTEKINGSSHTAPSKRIIKELQQSYNYDKSHSGVYVTDKVGIEELKAKCSHFNNWTERLKAVSAQQQPLMRLP
ncbi:hypothetical protein Barb7_00844 [Bacteroidales bacterium Barb7]|nr:hypothetical protein Barb7_00844 [Bacteroidales bacterium Barb7]